MEKSIIQKDVIRIALIVGLILLVPLCGNLFATSWNWSVGDFVIMGALLFATGLCIDLAARKIADPAQRIFAIAAIVLVLLSVWIELAVGAISQLLHFLFS